MKNDELSIDCKICGKLKTYKSKFNYEKGKDLPCRSCANSISRGGEGNRVVVDGKFKCISCKDTKDVVEFHLRKDGRMMSYCKVCQKDKRKEYYKDHYKYSRYGLVKEDYDKMLKDQDYKCKTCLTHLDNPAIDHCHSSGEVRGLLCFSCNVCLGSAKDNTETLARMVKYLKGDLINEE